MVTGHRPRCSTSKRSRQPPVSPLPNARAISRAPCTPSAPERRSRQFTSQSISNATSPRKSIRRSSSSSIGSIIRPATMLRARLPVRSPRLRRRSRRRQSRKEGPSDPAPWLVEQYVLTNPALNYAQFLLRAILPTILHVLAAAAAGYAVGSEFSSRRGQRAWLRAAGGSPLAALVGKLAPLFLVFVVMMVSEALVIHRVAGVPFRGDPLLMSVSACMLILAYLSIGALFQLLVRNLASGLSITAIFCSPAFGFSGVGFPVLGMKRLCSGLGFDAAVTLVYPDSFRPSLARLAGIGLGASLRNPGGLAISSFALAWWRLCVVARKAPVRPAVILSLEADTRGLGKTLAAEARRIFADRGVFAMIVLAPLIYGLLYPQPYLGQLLRGIPVAGRGSGRHRTEPRSRRDLERGRSHPRRGKSRDARGSAERSGPSPSVRDPRHFQKAPNARS